MPGTIQNLGEGGESGKYWSRVPSFSWARWVSPRDRLYTIVPTVSNNGLHRKGSSSKCSITVTTPRPAVPHWFLSGLWVLLWVAVTLYTRKLAGTVRKNQNKKKAEEVLEEEEYVVEKVLDWQVVKGQVEYLLKWQRVSDEDNTWEPGDNLTALTSLLSFCSHRKQHPRQINQTKASAKLILIQTIWGRRANQRRRKESEKSQGFAWGLEAEQIIEDTDSSGELMFLTKWKNSDEADLVPAKEAKVKCPQVVISSYEEMLMWHSYPSEDDDKKENKNWLSWIPATVTSDCGFQVGREGVLLVLTP